MEGPDGKDDGRAAGGYELVHAHFDARRRPGRPSPPVPVKCYGFPDELMAQYQNVGFLPDLVLALETLFGQMTYLGPLREYPHRRYVWSGERPQDVGRRGEDAVAALLAARLKRVLEEQGRRA